MKRRLEVDEDWLEAVREDMLDAGFDEDFTDESIREIRGSRGDDDARG
jgi:hypothetical protein